MDLATAVISTGTVLGGVGLMFRFINSKINQKQEKEVCHTMHDAMAKELSKGDEKFKEIIEAQRSIITTVGTMNDTLTVIKTDLKWMKKKNGGE